MAETHFHCYALPLCVSQPPLRVQVHIHILGMSCEGACAHAHVQCAVARVRAKSILKSVQDVRACGSFLGVRCATVFLHTFGTILPENTILERPIQF